MNITKNREMRNCVPKQWNLDENWSNRLPDRLLGLRMEFTFKEARGRSLNLNKFMRCYASPSSINIMEEWEQLHSFLNFQKQLLTQILNQ